MSHSVRPPPSFSSPCLLHSLVSMNPIMQRVPPTAVRLATIHIPLLSYVTFLPTSLVSSWIYGPTCTVNALCIPAPSFRLSCPRLPFSAYVELTSGGAPGAAQNLKIGVGSMAFAFPYTRSDYHTRALRLFFGRCHPSFVPLSDQVACARNPAGYSLSVSYASRRRARCAATGHTYLRPSLVLGA